MMNTRQEVNKILYSFLSCTVDAAFEGVGFVRRSNSLKYERKLPNVIQEIKFAFDVNPRNQPDAIADMLPHLTLCFPEISKIALEMVNGDTMLIADAPEITLRQQIHISGPGAKLRYWYLYGDDRDIDCIRSICEFTESWVLPLLNEFTDATAVVKAYELNDERILKQRHFFIYVAAAYVLLESPRKAMQVLEERLGRPGTRRTHAKVFEYVEQLLTN